MISSAAALNIGAGSTFSTQDMTRPEYEAALRFIENARPGVLALCDARATSQERDFCRTEAAAAEMVRTAEIEQAYRRSEGSARALQRTRIDARYQLDRARCGLLGGLKRDTCLIQAHAAKGRARLDAAAPYEVRL